MRALHVVVLYEGGRGRLGLLQVRRPIQGEALLLIGPVVAFDKTILLGVMRITDVDLDAQTGAKARASRQESHCPLGCPPSADRGPG